ncbi:MAG: MoaD/ThiS family protein [Planctomycetia bacterium]
MTVRVYLFALARDLAGAASVDVDLADEPTPTVADLRYKLSALLPTLEPLLARSLITVDETYARDDAPIAAGATVAVIPPVSGG